MLKIKFFKNSRLPLKKIILALAVVGGLVIIGYFGYDYYMTNKELSEFRMSEEALAIKERNDLLKKVGKLALLPENEDPTIATVTDSQKIRNQKFFSRAEDGDKVIIFTKSQRAILYRPNIGKIIESAPININDLETGVSQNQPPVSDNEILGDNTGDTITEEPEKLEEEREPAKIAVYNGTLYVEGLATQVGAYLVKEFPGNDISIEILRNANEVYDETIIINSSEEYADIAQQISEVLSGTIEEKPEDIDFPDVDIVVIAGTDLDVESLK